MNFEEAISRVGPLMFAITVCSLLTANTVASNGGEISREQAVEIAKQELRKAASDPERYEVFIDEDNKGWHGQMSLLRESSSKSSQEEYRKYSSILEGRRYWTIFLVGKSVDGRYPKDDSFTAIIEKESGKILFFIPGG